MYTQYISQMKVSFNIMQYVHIPTFIASFAFGMFAVYIYTGDSRKIYVYPTPENVAKLQYRDKTGTCFEYIPEKVTCPKEKDIAKVPAQS